VVLTAVREELAQLSNASDNVTAVIHASGLTFDLIGSQRTLCSPLERKGNNKAR